MNFRVYLSLDELKRVLEDDELEEGKADDVLRQFCVRASGMFDTLCTNRVYPRRSFAPVYETRYFDHPVSGNGGSILVPATIGRADQLRLYDDLLAIDTLTTENGATTIGSSDYLLHTWPSGYYPTPYDTISLQPNGTTTQFSYATTPYKANALTGWWGYHEDWANAWEDSGDTVQDDPLTDSATTLTVSDVDGDDINGISNRFQNLQLLRIEDEYVWVSKANPSDDQLTITRNANGTTAAEHAQNTPIYIYRPMPDVRLALEYLAMHLYQRKDSVGTPDQRPLAAAKGLLVFPASMPKEVQEIIDRYSKEAL